jgi:drug/metabolite transporter (DMT)-like permease
MAVIALAAHYVFVAAFARADVSALAPVEYTALIWAVLTGYVIHCESLRHRAQAGSKGPLESQRYYALYEETENETN